MSAEQQKRNSLRQTWQLLGLVAGMFAFGFALGPLYTAICNATGFNGKWSGTAQDAAAEPLKVDTSRKVRVLFVTTVNGGNGYEFKAEQSSVEVHPGEFSTVSFYARNTGGNATVAQAVPHVAPWEATKHLKKTECFCFNNQPFGPGEVKHMPVRFMLDPDMPSHVDTVTLSYTFFDVTQRAANSGAANKS